MEYDESYYVCCVMEHDAKPNTKSELKYCHQFGHPLFNVIFFPEENYSQDQSVPRGCGIAGGWHRPTLIFFQLELGNSSGAWRAPRFPQMLPLHQQLQGIYSQKKKKNFLQRSENEGRNKKQFKCLNYNAKSQGNKTEQTELLACWVDNKQ